MKILKFINLLILIFLINPALAENTVFGFGKYDIENEKEEYGQFEKLSQVLKISDADELEVTVVGRIENECKEKDCDVLRIYNSEGEEIKKFTGKLNEHFVVADSSIRVTFYSDGRREYEGAIVRIKSRSLNHIFSELKEKLLKSVNKILKYGAREIYTKIDKNYSTLNVLYNQLSNNGDVKGFIDEIMQKLGDIAQTYREINNMRDDILKVHEEEFEKIKNLKTKTLSSTQRVQQKKQKYLSLLNKSEQAFVDIDDVQEKKRLELSITGYKNIIQNIEIQKSVLSNFDTLLNTLDEALRQHSEKILMLLYILEINAQIYEQAANIPIVNQSFVGNLTNLNDLSEIKRIVEDIRQSEQEIVEQLETIKKTDFE